jgi:hypothetical protein
VANATTTTIAAGDLGNDAVGTGNIQDDAITNALIATDAVNQDSIAANSVTAVEIVAGTITATELAADSVTATKIDVTNLAAINADLGSITAGSIDGVTVKIGSGASVFKADTNGIYLGDETFANAEFRVTPAGAITATSATITGTITATNIDNSTVTYSGGNLQVGSIGTSNINNDAVTNALIATDAVNQDSIAANAVTATEIVSGTITATEIASNTITAGQIASNTITATQIAANTLTANEIQAASITVDKLSGDVSELYPASIYENITLTSTTQFTQDFAIPAPSLGISKRQRLDLDFDFSTANTSGTDHEVQFTLNIQKKSKGATGTAVGTVTTATGAPPFNQWVYISGNVLALVDNTGGVADNSSGSGTTGNVQSVYYDSGNNRTYIMVSAYGTVFSDGETMYFSPSKFASAGTWVEADYGIDSRIFVPTGKTVNVRIPFSNTYGESSTVTEFRPSIVGTTNISNVTCRLVKWIGTMENVS